jgi:tetratricopeptide (TPR) repeat protein
MNQDPLRDLLSQGLSDEEIARALLDLTLQAASPDLADAVRVCALPAWFDAGHLALLADKDEAEAAALLEKIAAFSFVLPRDAGGYVYHEATRARLLDWWREPDHRPRFAALNDRLARYYLALAQEQCPRLSGPDYLDALAVMDAAYPNVRAAWEGVVESGNWELVRDFAYALHGYFQCRGMWAERIAWTQAGLEVCEREGDAESCAGMQNNLGNAYADLPTGDRAANLEKAIECYRQALRFYTPEAAPLDYAMTQNNLGNAYADLPTGDRAANLEKAIECYRQALRFRTPEAAPLGYAMTQNNLGTAYWSLPTGDRAANLEKAIECYRQALRFRTPEVAPLGYATTQNNLGVAYADLPTGDRAANLEKAIECYRQALRFYTPEAAPLDYAMTQNNLGLAYSDLPTGDRAANLEKAIECYHQALRFYTPEAAPLDYAMTQNNLGLAYADLPTGDRAANLEKAIECYRQALRIYTPEAAPLDYAKTQNNLGLAYSDLPTGDRAANLEKAIECYHEALSIEHVPVWERTRYLRNLGDTHVELEDYPPAITAYQQAIDLSPDDPWLFDALGNAYSHQDRHEEAIEAYTSALALATDDADRALFHRNRASDLIYLHRLDEAERDCEQARALAPDHPYTHDRLGQLAFAREDYPAAVEHYTAAIDRQPKAGFYFDRGLAHLALHHQDQALADYQAAIPIADSITKAEALKDLDRFATDHPDVPGLAALRSLLSP